MNLPTVNTICNALARLAPLRAAESWDNVGLLIGDRSMSVDRAMTCLTISPAVVDEAVDQRVNMIVTHHPLPFRPVDRITCDSVTGRLLWRLIGARIAVYSAHTAFDSAANGINQAWAESLGLESIQPLIESIDGGVRDSDFGSGRRGRLPQPMIAREVIRRCARWVADATVVHPRRADAPLRNAAARGVGPLDQPVSMVAFACGSGGSFVPHAVRHQCQLLVTGEATFHQCLEAESAGLSLGLLGHFQSERFAMESLALQIAAEYPELTIWPSRLESDPIVPID